MAPFAHAEMFHCNSFVIDVGMPKMEVLNKCGAPGSREARIERRVIRTRQTPVNISDQGIYRRNELVIEREVEVQLEDWIYNFGPQSFMRLLTFEDGRLKSVESMAYGK
jgi:hypothetical protein